MRERSIPRSGACVLGEHGRCVVPALCHCDCHGPLGAEPAAVPRGADPLWDPLLGRLASELNRRLSELVRVRGVEVIHL